jgi:hypothetical protein
LKQLLNASGDEVGGIVECRKRHHSDLLVLGCGSIAG